jgi:hypothetical protein
LVQQVSQQNDPTTETSRLANYLTTLMNRIGFHYFPDTQHYRQQDLLTWLPKLQSLRAAWLVLVAPTQYAIPESFIRAIIEANIQPVLHFHLDPADLPTHEDLQLLCKTYRRWGVRHIVLFDQPNTHKIWQAASWSQADLVERFLDLYLPLANISLKAGLTPIFPPLKPGGDYWDTAFLRRALESIRRRRQDALLARLVIGAYARAGEHPLQWGAGGPERWPNARPYYTPPGVEDQRGFRIFDWYLAFAKAALGTTLPIFLFEMGYHHPIADSADKNISIARLAAGESVEGLEPIPSEVIGGAFEPLVASTRGPDSLQGWFHQNGQPSPLVEAFHQWAGTPPEKRKPSDLGAGIIRHYLLLPSYEWGISDYHLDIIRPFIKKYQPTIGFSLEETRNAQRVTVIGGEHAFTENSLNQLRQHGIQVERIPENGTNIASLLADIL